MSKDPYQPCPCGSGKKIKFCCKESAAEIDRISKLIDADQRQAALELIERLLKKKPDLQCLHAFKLQLAIGDPDRDSAKAAIDGFLKIAPTNPTALAAQAIRLAAEWDLPEDESSSYESCRAAVATLQRSLSNRGKYVTVLMQSAISIVGRRLMSEGMDLAAAAHFQLAAMFAEKLDRPADDLAKLMSSQVVSLLVKNRIGLPEPPADASWKDEYNAARVKAANGAWADAASLLEGLAQSTLGEPLPRRALGLLYAYLGESGKAVELLRRSAAMDNVSLAEAIDSEALAQLLDEKQRPTIESLEVQCPVDDSESVKEKLLSDSHAVSFGDELNHLADEDGVPPIAVFWLIDRPQPDPDEQLTVANVPRELAVIHLFGKQTDREARLDYVVESRDHESTKRRLREMLGDTFLDDSKVVNREQYAAEVSLRDDELWFPPGTSVTVRTAIEADANRQVLIDEWADQSNCALDGKTPREAAQDGSLTVRLEAALMVLEACQLAGLDREIFQQLRESLGLERTSDIVCHPGAIRRIPLVHLTRVDCSRLADDDLAAGFEYATSHAAIEASLRFGDEILRRPNVSESARIVVNFNLYRLAIDPDKALAYLHEAQRLTKEAGQSPARMLIHELTLRAIRHEPNEFQDVYSRITKRHINESGIRDELLSTMVRLGLLRPDGSPVAPEPVAVGAAAGEGESTLWTPDSEGDTESGEGKSKLWLPGQD